MSRRGEVTFAWGDGEHVFKLDIDKFDELQNLTDCGPFELFRRLATGTWRVKDIRETLRLGLMGGGMKSIPALSLVARYFDKDVPAEHVLSAQRILLAGLFGPAEDNVGKKAEAVPGSSESSQTDASVSLQSMETAPPSDTPMKRSAE